MSHIITAGSERFFTKMKYVDVNGISVAYTEPYSASYKLP